jgi:hypothetical protein
MVNAEPAQGEGEHPGCEDGVIVGTDGLGFSVVFDRIEQQAQNRDRRFVFHSLQRQHGAAAVIDDAEDRLWVLRIRAVFGEVDAPDFADGAGGEQAMRIALWIRHA